MGMCSERGGMTVEPAQPRGRAARGGEQAVERGRAIARPHDERHLERNSGLSATHVSATGMTVREDSPTTATARPSTTGVWARSSSALRSSTRGSTPAARQRASTAS